MTRDHSHDHYSTVVQVSDPDPIPGRLGITRHGSGLDVTVVARVAATVKFYATGSEGSKIRYRLFPSNEGIRYGYTEGRRTGAHYGFCARGLWDSDSGLLHNPVKLLFDPRTRGLEGIVDMVSAVYVHMVNKDLYPTHHPSRCSPFDSHGYAPYSIVVDNRFAVALKPRVP